MFPTVVRDLSRISGVHMLADFPFGNILGLGGGVGEGGSGLGVLARPVFLETFAKITVAPNHSDYCFMLLRHVPALDKLQACKWRSLHFQSRRFH